MAANFTASGVDYLTETDVDAAFDDDSFLKFKQALDVHTHRAGLGLGVGRIGSAVPAAAGDVQVTGHQFRYWDTTSGGTRTLDLAGDLTLGAAFGVTFTPTATTAVTLPVSGTLATLAGSETLSNKTFSDTILMSAAASRIRPGATSFALRNNADSADNLLMTDAGAATVRASLAVGTTPATSGTIRLPNGGSVTARNAGDTANVTVLSPSGPNLSVGDATLLNLLLPNGGSHHFGTAALRSVTNPTNALNLYNGTAPSGTLTNGVTLYAAAGELRVMDAAGTSTLLSPHDDAGRWVFDSTDTTTGRRLRIDVEKLLRFLDAHFGLGFVHEEGLDGVTDRA
jgi:hypothetical protein